MYDRPTAVSLFIIVMMVCGLSVSITAQKSEHYNSPLYSPRYYDPAAGESNGLPQALNDVGIDQKLGDQLPLETPFRDENGRDVKLGDFFDKGRPVVIAFVYYECPMLCTQVLNGLTGSMKGMSLTPGKDYDVVAISFDANEFDKSELAHKKKDGYVERLGNADAANGMHFLTGQQSSIDAVTKAAGFKYKWDEASKQFAHIGAVMVATPEGKMSRYLYGIDYSPKDLKFAIMESSSEKIGGPAEQLMLYCYHYDPATGKYGLSILRIMRAAAIATILGLGAMLLVFWRKNKKNEHLTGESES